MKLTRKIVTQNHEIIINFAEIGNVKFYVKSFKPSNSRLPNCISVPRQCFGSGSLYYSGSLPRRLLRQNTTSTVASNSANQPSGFKYAEAHEIATATLRHGCLQPTVGNFSPNNWLAMYIIRN